MHMHTGTHIHSHAQMMTENPRELCLQQHPIARWIYLSHWEDDSYDYYAFSLTMIQI